MIRAAQRAKLRLPESVLPVLSATLNEASSSNSSDESFSAKPREHVSSFDTTGSSSSGSDTSASGHSLQRKSSGSNLLEFVLSPTSTKNSLHSRSFGSPDVHVALRSGGKARVKPTIDVRDNSSSSSSDSSSFSAE